MKDPGDTASRGPADTGIVWYGVALVLYIVAGYFLKSVVLNWIVGPLFPLLALYFVPRLLGRPKRAEPVE